MCVCVHVDVGTFVFRERTRAALQQLYSLKLQAVMYHQRPVSNRGLLVLYLYTYSCIWCNAVHHLWIWRAFEQYITIINHWIAVSFSWSRWTTPRFYFKVFPWFWFHIKANITVNGFIRCGNMAVILKWSSLLVWI